jgi:glutathione transport system ATP-binding protein
LPHSDELDASDVLAVSNLNIAFEQEQQRVSAVRNLSFRLKRGETLAIVGESGSGKSVTALSLMRLIEQSGGEVSCDEMLLRRRNRQVIELGEQSASQMRHVRGADIAMIFQEPMTSLNPVFTVGEQIAESIRLHPGCQSRRGDGRSEAECSIKCVSRGEGDFIALSTPAFRRYAPAGDDRHGTVVSPCGFNC